MKNMALSKTENECDDCGKTSKEQSFFTCSDCWSRVCKDCVVKRFGFPLLCRGCAFDNDILAETKS